MSDIIHISYAKIYKFERIVFEWSDYLGPVFLRLKDLQPKNNQWRTNREYASLDRFLRLSESDKEEFRLI